MSVSIVPAANALDRSSDHRLGVSSHPIPAWLLSFMLHFGLVVSGSLLLRAGALTGGGQGVGDRGGEIVLYTGSTSNEKNYLTEEEVGSGSDETPTESEPTTDVSAAPDAAPMIPGVGLPKAVSGSGVTQATTNAVSATGGMRRLGPSSGRSGGAATAVFGTIGEGQRFVYVFDRSSSMRATNFERDPFNAAKRELLASLANLGDIHQFGIIFYNHEQTSFGNESGSSVRLYFAKKENRVLAERFVSGMSAQGATKHLPALKIALEAHPDVIFFLTDADDPVLTEEDLRKIKGWNAGTVINAIQFGYGPKQNFDSFLEQLTTDNGGMYRYVDVQQLPRAK